MSGESKGLVVVLVGCLAAAGVAGASCGGAAVQFAVLEEGASDLVFQVQVAGLASDGQTIIPEGTLIELESDSACECYKAYGGGTFESQGAIYSMYFDSSAGTDFQIVCRHPLNSKGALCLPKLHAVNYHHCDGRSRIVDVGNSQANIEYQTDDDSSDIQAESIDNVFESRRQGQTISLAVPVIQPKQVHRVQLLFAPGEQEEANGTMSILLGSGYGKWQQSIVDFDAFKSAPDAHRQQHGFALDMENWNFEGDRLYLKITGKPAYLSGVVLQARGPSVVVTVQPDARRQTLKGIGVNIVFYLNWLTGHRNREDIYDLIFRQLRPQVLRVRNDYGFKISGQVDTNLAALLLACSDYMGYLPVIMMGSWGAPKQLQANGSVTLDRNDSNQFPYDQYAQHWMDSLDAHEKLSVVPNMVFIQNEPDYHHPDDETTLFDVRETSTLPGFGDAASAVYNRFTEREYRPPLIGPDTTGLNWSAMSKYFVGMNKSEFQSYSHHYYSGGDWDRPDDFYFDMTRVRDIRDKDKFMTEYSRWVGDRDSDDYFKLGWMMHNAMTWEEVNMYNHWDLFWEPGQASLIGLENAWREDEWQTSNGFIVHKTIYTLMLWTRFVPQGWSRVLTSSSLGERGEIRASSYVHPFGSHDTTMLLNFRSDSYPVDIKELADEQRSRSVFCTSRLHNFTRLGTVTPLRPLILPPRAICAVTTLHS